METERMLFRRLDTVFAQYEPDWRRRIRICCPLYICISNLSKYMDIPEATKGLEVEILARRPSRLEGVISVRLATRKEIQDNCRKIVTNLLSPRNAYLFQCNWIAVTVPGAPQKSGIESVFDGVAAKLKDLGVSMGKSVYLRFRCLEESIESLGVAISA